MTVVPGDDDRPDRVEMGGSAEPADAPGPVGPGDARDRSWRTNPSDLDVDTAFAGIVSGMITDSVRRHPSGATSTTGVEPGPTPDMDVDRDVDSGADRGAAPDTDRTQDSASERARRRELRRMERAAEVAAFAESQAQTQAERDADQEHFTPPDPPPLPRPRLRTIGSLLMIVAGIGLLTRPGILAVSADLAMVLAALLIVGGAILLVTGIWRRRGGGDGWDDGAAV